MTQPGIEPTTSCTRGECSTTRPPGAVAQMWITLAKETCVKYRITENELTGSNLQKDMIIRERVASTFKGKINRDRKDKSKIQYLMMGMEDWKPHRRARYMRKLNREDCSPIFICLFVCSNHINVPV